jgi:hypothetical protein
MLHVTKKKINFKLFLNQKYILKGDDVAEYDWMTV